MSKRYLSTTRFFKGKLLTIVESLLLLDRKTVSRNHKEFKFIEQTKAINFRKSSSVGIYSDKEGKKVFIKDYAYTLKNLEYEYLHNEINTLKVLNYTKLPKSLVQVPQLIFAEDFNNRITIVTEFINGKTLDNLSQEQMQKVLLDVFRFLEKQTQNIPYQLLKTIPNRNLMLTYVTFPIYFCRAFLKEPAKRKLFIESFKQFIQFFPTTIFQSAPYGICHRDLSVDNIIYDERTKLSTILDTECMVRADKLYDLALLPRLFIRYLTPGQMLSIFKSLKLKRSEKQRLIILMIASTINKIAVEKKGLRDYINAINGLSLITNTLVPAIMQQL